MAAAAPPPLASSEDKTNGAKLSRLLIDGGTTVLRSAFDHHHPPANLAADLNTNFSTLNNLLRRRVLNGHQWDQLFPPGGAAPDSNTFDITLLFLLLTTICGLSPPPTGWHAKPPPSDKSHEANLARIKFFRNVLYGHVTTTGVDTHSFSALWLEISAVLVALGLSQPEIDRLKAERCGEDDYLDALREWADSEKDIKTLLNDMHQTQTKTQLAVQKSHETLKESKSKLEEVLHIGKNMQQVVTEIRQCQLNTDQGLSQAQIKTQETVQDNKHKQEEVHQVVTEIRQSQLNTDQEEEILKKLAKVDTQNNVKYYTERYLEGTRESIFAKVKNWLDDRSSPSRVMVIIGNAGMGKSVIAAEMCKKMQEDGRLSGSHFCQHNKARHRNPKVMLQSLACHLSYSLPEYRNALLEQLSRNLGLEISDMEVGDLFELLFEEPLSRLSDPGFTSLVVIDALDESEYQGRNELLDVIAKYFNKLPLWIRFLITTRPEINIWDSLKNLQPLQLKPNDEENLNDIRHIFEQRLSHVLQDENLDLIVEELVQKSEGLMLWAQLLVDFIKENFPILTLENLDSAVPSGISSVYQSYFKRLETELFKELKITEERFLSLLGVIAAARDPLPLGFVSKLFFPSASSPLVQRKVNKAIACISSLLPVHDDCIHFFHKSVKDWLADKSLYGQHDYSVDEHEGHRVLSSLCIDEFNEVKRKGVDSLQLLSDTTKYALQHGVQHMLELDEEKRPCSLEEIIKKYVIDVELVYAKLCVNVAAASEDIVCINKYCAVMQSVLASFLFLLRKHREFLKEFPHVIFQMLLNEGGPELCSEASNLLETKYSDVPYMEYVYKNDVQGIVQTKFYCSSQVACLDVSPQSDYMVCECRDGTIKLWSLHTGNLVWKRPVIKMKFYLYEGCAHRTSHSSSRPLLSCFSSVIFHPSIDVILPGVLSHAYTFNGDLNRLFPESKCAFSVCSISGDKILTDCSSDGKCLILWSLKDGAEITRTTRDEDVLSFAWSRDGRLLAISHSTGTICLVDVMNGFQTLAETKCVFSERGMIKFSPDHRFLYCWHFPSIFHGWLPHHLRFNVNIGNHQNVSLEVSSQTSVFEDPYAFLLGDSLASSATRSPATLFLPPLKDSFLFVLNKQSVLKSSPNSDVIDLLYLSKLFQDRRLSVRKPFVRNLVFSINGDTIYVVTHELEGARLTAWDVSSGELKGEKKNVSEIRGPDDCRLVAVREGVLFTTSRGTMELWNPDLSECIRCGSYVGNITEMIPISDERVVCTVGEVVIILDTTRKREIVSKQLFGMKFVACNSKCQLVTVAYSLPGSLQLSYEKTSLWRKSWPPFERERYLQLPAMFSPAEEFLIIWKVTHEDDRVVYVLDAISGNTLHVLRMDNCVFDCKFVSDVECVILTSLALNYCCLRLFNVRTGDQLGVIDVEDTGIRLASCPRKGLVAFEQNYSERLFRVIKVKLPDKNKDHGGAKGAGSCFRS